MRYRLRHARSTGAGGRIRTSEGHDARRVYSPVHLATLPPLHHPFSKIHLGAGGGIRTHDLLITSQPLYHLSYTGLLMEGPNSAYERSPHPVPDKT